MTAYYNDNEPFMAQWLRGLIAQGHIAPGDVDERSIVDVKPDDLKGYDQCHFFAGLGGWSHALRLAGWPDDRPVWTGSCPCQPFSEAGKRAGFDDQRHLWPVWFRLIQECGPAIAFGEQVASKDGVVWFDRVAADLEAANYACGALVLPANSVGAGHRRDRFFFAAHAIGTDAGGRLAHRWGRSVSREVAKPWAYANWQGGLDTYGGLADGLPATVAKSVAGGFGNAIVPELAAEFVAAFVETQFGL